MDKLFDLSGKVAVVTGGMGQLGIEYSIALAERNVKVAVFDVAKTPKLENTVLSKYMKKKMKSRSGLTYRD